MKHFVFAIILTFPFQSFSQQLFQDASGKGSLFFNKNDLGYLTYNSSDKSSTIGYARNRDNGYDMPSIKSNWLTGADFKINIKDGIGALVSGGNFKPGLTLSGLFGIFTDDFRSKGHYASYYARPSISYTQYSYIDTGNGSANLTKEKKVEGGVLVNFNFQFNKDLDAALTKHYYIFAGLQTGFNVINNYSDLDDVQLNSFIQNSGSTAVIKSETGKFGKYKSYKVLPLNIDLGVTPRLFKHNYFGFNAYFRSNFFKPKNSINTGIGIYLADDKKPSNISGGVAWQFNDVTNNLKKPGNAIDKSSIFFYVGYTIH